MAKYVFTYHGVYRPASAEEGQKMMAEWGEWVGPLGAAVVDYGAPFGPSTTVSASSVEEGTGSDPATGYGIFSAENMEAAISIAKGCPLVSRGCRVAVNEVAAMPAM